MNLPQKTIDELIAFNNDRRTHGRYNAALAMQQTAVDGTTNIVVVKRTSEPCYGFLRKYKSTHPDATEPENKPSDLHHPFPEGIPLAIAFPFYGLSAYERMIDFVTSDKSPWITGFGKPENLIKTYNDKQEWTGYLLVDTDVDPTVLINLMKFIHDAASRGPKFNKMIAEGLSDFEALVTVTLDGQSYYPTGADTYMFASVVDLKKMKEGKVNKFSKGTFKERADYSRKNIQDIFKDPKGVKFAAELEKEAGGGGYILSVKQYATAAKKVFERYL